MNNSEHVPSEMPADPDRPATATSDGNPPSGRDANGRFARGNGGGPGNPFARRVAEFRQVFYDCVTAEDLKAIVAKLVEKARAGDPAATKLVLQYLVGKPAATVDPDTLDLHEMELYRQAPAPTVLSEVLMARMPADLACDTVRAFLPYVAQSQADAMRDELEKPIDPEESEEADMDDDEVFARLQAAERAAAEAKSRQATAAPAPRADGEPRTPAPSTNGPAGAARPDCRHRPRNRGHALGALELDVHDARPPAQRVRNRAEQDSLP